MSPPQESAHTAQDEADRTTVVIGIHGLLNKPPKETLALWWKKALDEGLDRNGDGAQPYNFELVYWADVRNPAPVSSAEQDEPYIEAAPGGELPRYQSRTGDHIRDIAQKWGGRLLDWEKEYSGIGRNVEGLLEIKLEDLDEYYSVRDVRRRIRDRLSRVLRQHAGSSILLVAHSMGSIIAYDVLRELEDASGLSIEHLVTIGSPLGLPYVSFRAREEFGPGSVPRNVQRWSNLADPGDKVAVDARLSDEYSARDGIAVEDKLVTNVYLNPAGEPNNHKSYGYLRTPEFTDLLREFLNPGSP